MLNKIQAELEKQCPDLRQKSKIFQNYMSLQHVQKQRKLINWWQQMIESAIRKSGQIYLSPADLEIIFSLHGLKPVPLEKVLQFLNKTSKIQWVRNQKQDAKEKGKENSGWFGTIANYLWKPPSIQKQRDVTKSGFKTMQNKLDQKIIPKNYKLQLQQHIKSVIKKQLGEQNSISYDYIRQRLKHEMNISPNSIDILLNDLEKSQWFKTDQVQNKHILFYTNDQKVKKDPKWIQIQKSKFAIKSTLEIFDKKINQRLNQETKKLQEARSFIEVDQNRSKRLLSNVVSMRKTTNQLQNRRKIMRQTLDQLQMNQVNWATLDIVGKCQKIIQSTMVDASEIENIKDKHLQISYNNKEINSHLDEMTNGEIRDQVENMLAQLQQQIVQEKKYRKKQQEQKQKSKSKEISNYPSNQKSRQVYYN